MSFILGVSITLNIIFLIIGIVAYKKVLSNPYLGFLSNIKPKVEKDEFREWKL